MYKVIGHHIHVYEAILVNTTCVSHRSLSTLTNFARDLHNCSWFSCTYQWYLFFFLFDLPKFCHISSICDTESLAALHEYGQNFIQPCPTTHTVPLIFRYFNTGDETLWRHEIQSRIWFRWDFIDICILDYRKHYSLLDRKSVM